MTKHLPLLLALTIAALAITGCGDKESTEPQVLVIVTPDSAAVDLCGALEIIGGVENAEDSLLDWYVNDILSGDGVVGTITQANRALYTAPAHMPNPPQVLVKAVSRADPSEAAICIVTFREVGITDLYVNASVGNDQTGTGCPAKPVKSISRALALARPGTTIHVAAGTYNAAGGEVFPLVISDSITVVGDNWETCVITGRCGSNYNQTATIRGDRPVLRKFTLEEGGGTGEPWDLAIWTDPSALGALIDSIRILDAGDFAVIRVQGAHDCVISNCYLVTTDLMANRALEICSSDAGTIIKNCTVSGFFTGLFFNNTSDAKVEGCTIEGNRSGIELCCLQYEGSIPNPDFGGGARGSIGGNVVRNNSVCGLYNDTPNDVFAKYNTWTNDPPVEGTDFCNVGGGSVAWH